MVKIMAENGHGGCEHKPPAVILDGTGRGYRILCLTCGGVGPQRKDFEEAWADLENRRHQEPSSSRRPPIY